MYFDKLDTDLWKDIQDRFSKEINLPVYTIDMDGKEVVSSGNIPFLVDMIKSKREDIFRERNQGQLRDLEGEDVALYKFFGAVHLIRPVFLHDKMIGAVVCGPIRAEEYDYVDLAARLGVEESELRYAAEDIKSIDNEKIAWYRKLVSILATIAPKLAYQKQSRDTRISKLTALYNIIRKVNSTLELEDVLKHIMEFLVGTLNAADCSVFVYTEEGENKYCLKAAVEKMAEVEKVVSRKAIEEKKPITVKDIKQRFSVEVDDDYNSMLSIPLRLKDKIIGTINIYGGSVGEITEESLNFISVMADQIAIAVANAQRYEEVKELAVVDKLTGVYNRRYFSELLEKALIPGISVENPVALILLDIDNFGNYNNTHGHPKGDELLKELSKIVKDNVRKEDSIGRYGGEEFIVLLPKATPQIALEVAENIKKSIADYAFYGRELQPNGRVTVSIGLVVCRTNISSKELIKEVDESLYNAKNSGKNKVVQKVLLGNGLKAEI